MAHGGSQLHRQGVASRRCPIHLRLQREVAHLSPAREAQDACLGERGGQSAQDAAEGRLRDGEFVHAGIKATEFSRLSGKGGVAQQLDIPRRIGEGEAIEANVLGRNLVVGAQQELLVEVAQFRHEAGEVVC